MTVRNQFGIPMDAFGNANSPYCEPSKKDDVNQPEHYTYGGIETIDYMQAKSSPEEFRGHLRLTAMKYLSRAGHKDDILKDYKKAAVYLNWLIKYIETGSIK